MANDSGTIRLIINSGGIETLPVFINDAKTGETKLKHFVYGSVNGAPFQIPCDEQVEVSHEIAELLLRLIRHG